ncbi:MAG TPA: tRNA (guanosine(37)-N1)-methyltransferase TrmD [Oscillospiraceae bacterium]|nr:tRNA (guanosine(37)-N1)-methyltransferase TrmD [Oscillospiraceae bacterium]HNW04813.1 tRNA (guanosine(37)-N1)-methyltransferase TrmD [Oscillospiraceae bacterium]
MRIDIMTLFPEMCEAVLNASILGRARRAGLFEARCHNIRDYSQEKHQKADDAPYGGGSGMIMQADPIFRCYEHVCEELCSKPHTIYLSPKGAVLTQQKAVALSRDYDNLLLLCGHYEGVDERVLEEIVDEEISLGDFVITGGELAALVLTDAVARLCDGVLSEDTCFEEESHYAGLLEYPQYTRPQKWHDKEVPEVLLSGNHREIAAWRRQKSLEITADRRPDLLGETHK